MTNLTEVGYLIFSIERNEGKFYPINKNRTFDEIQEFWNIGGFNCIQLFAKDSDELKTLLGIIEE